MLASIDRTRRGPGPPRAAAALVVLCLCALFLAALASADSVLLRPAGEFRVGAEGAVLLQLVNDADMQGLQFDLFYDPAAGEPTSIQALGRVRDPLRLHTKVLPGLVRVLIYDETPARAPIIAGEDDILSVSFAIPETEAGLLHVSLSHPLGADQALSRRSLAPQSIAIPVAARAPGVEIAARSGNLAGSRPEVASAKPTRFALRPEGPNPFARATSVRYEVPRSAFVKIAVYDVSGRMVRVLSEGFAEVGTHLTRWDGTMSNGSRAGPGLYFVRMSAENAVHQVKLISLR